MLRSYLLRLMQKASFFILLMFLFSACTSSSCRQWELQEIITKRPCYNSSRLILAPDTATSNLEMEIVCDKNGMHIYLNLLLLEAPPWKEDPRFTKIEILEENQETKVIYPYLFKGGQRLLLQDEDANQIIQLLDSGVTFTMKIGRSRITVIPDNYKNLIKKD